MALNGSLFDLDKEIKWHIVYTLEGGVMFFCCGLLTCIILRHDALRNSKEFVIIGAQASADTFHGLATMVSGIRRLPLLLSGGFDTPTSMRGCFFTVHNMLWFFFLPTQNFMFIILSIDRLNSVVSPAKYLSYTINYSYKLIALAYFFGACMFVNAFQSAWPHTEQNQWLICHGWMAKEWYCEKMDRYLNVIAPVTSIVLYVLVPIFYKKNSMVNADNGDQMARKLRFQKRLTKTTGINCFSTFFFVLLPWIFATVTVSIEAFRPYYGTVMGYAFNLANINPILNLFIYVSRQKNIYRGLKRITKTLPPNLNLWAETSRQSGRRSTRKRTTREAEG